MCNIGKREGDRLVRSKGRPAERSWAFEESQRHAVGRQAVDAQPVLPMQLLTCVLHIGTSSPYAISEVKHECA